MWSCADFFTWRFCGGAGGGLESLRFLCANITIDTSSIQIIGSNKDTLKFVFNNITYIKFKAKELIEKLSEYNGKISITVAGKGNVNVWGGRETPQIFIEEIEINKIDDYGF